MQLLKTQLLMIVILLILTPKLIIGQTNSNDSLICFDEKTGTHLIKINELYKLCVKESIIKDSIISTQNNINELNELTISALVNISENNNYLNYNLKKENDILTKRNRINITHKIVSISINLILGSLLISKIF